MTTIIDDSTNNDILYPQGMGRGLVERDYDEFPVEMFAPPSEMDLIPRSEWSARIKEQEEQKSSLFHIWQKADNGKMPANLYQNGDPLCWAHSSTNAVMLKRATGNLPFEYLSAYGVAFMANGGKMTGGWCGQSAKLIADVGAPSQKKWPQQKYSSSYVNADVKADAAKYRITEEWRDLTRPVHGQVMTFDQVATCLLNNDPCACDFMWWAHSVCAVQLVEVEPGSFGLKILNSWGSNWGDNGFSVLRGNKAKPDGAIAIRSITGA